MVNDIEQFLNSPWEDLDVSLTELDPSDKFLNRKVILYNKYREAKNYLSDFLIPSVSVIDFSCGSGATMEIFRYHGASVFGTDFWMKNVNLKNPKYYKDIKKYSIFEPLLKSQNLQYIIHDGAIVPYPFDSNSYDLVINVGAINAYKGGFPVWENALNEFKRVSRKTIFFGYNTTENYEKETKFVWDWSNRQNDLRLTLQQHNFFRWDFK